MDSNNLYESLESFMKARWGTHVMDRPRAVQGASPWGLAPEPEQLRGLTWAVFRDAREPRAVGIRVSAVREGVQTLLLVHCRQSGEIESAHWWHDSLTGWQHIPRLEWRTSGCG
jgi:hypothetical protein